MAQRRRQWMHILGAAGLVAASVVTATTASNATATASGQRLQGANRFATAVAIASAKFPDGVPVAVLASGRNYADALAGAFLAGQGPAAVLLTEPGSVPPDLVAGLKSLLVEDVIILGGTSAVSATVEQQLANRPSSSSGAGNLDVVRIAGANRYETMAAVDTAIGPEAVGTVGGKRTAILASGANFPDALAAAPASYKAQLPIVLTEPGRLSPQAASTLQTLGIEQVLVMGGTVAVGDGVLADVQALGVAVLERIAGADRTDTAARFAEFEVANLGFTNDEITLARGDDFADALAGAQYAGDPKPTLLTQSSQTLGGPTADYLARHAAETNRITAFGGSSAISDGTLAAGVGASQGNPGGGPGNGTGGINITPKTIVNDGKDHSVTIQGPVDDTQYAWLVAADGGTGFCSGGAKQSMVIRGHAPNAVTGDFNISNTCAPGPYNLFVVLVHDDRSQETITCNACVSVTPASSVVSINPASIPANGTDGYTHEVVLQGTNLDTTTDVFARFTGTVEPAYECGDAVLALTNLRPNGTTELNATVRIWGDCPPGKWDVEAHDANGHTNAVCKGCLTVMPYQHVILVDSFTPSSARKGETFEFSVKGHGLQRAHLVIGTRDKNGQFVFFQWSGSATGDATQLYGTLAATADSPPGTYSIGMFEEAPGGGGAPPPPGSRNVCADCFTLTP